MELKTKDGMNLITDDDLHAFKEAVLLMKSIKNRFFSLGRDLDKFLKVGERFTNDKS